ncbi:FG-GAP repeat domain-containing protein [Streptomyces sp. NPDC002730]|uniref:FG-GAP repeat domain-containing protein n=1 Tax=Streptomyces sp. NPDC002730 TaxID=3364662 RepID=UPI0036A587B5
MTSVAPDPPGAPYRVTEKSMTLNRATRTKRRTAALVMVGLAAGLFPGSEAAWAAAPNYAAKVDYATGDLPLSVSTGDLNGDGDRDLVTANQAADTVSVLLGNGDGTFAAKVDYTTGNGPFSVAVGDVNGDGDRDLVTANLYADTVSVLLGNGDGTFAAKVDYTTGDQPYSVAAGDFDGDGDLDLVTANQLGNTVSVLLGNGDGTFAAKVDYTTGSSYVNGGDQPVSVATGDFNGDGDLDLITANARPDTVSVLLGTAGGTFGAPVRYSTSNSITGAEGHGPFSVAVGDFNGDGNLDLGAANFLAYPSGLGAVMLGNGDGTFAAIIDFATGNRPVSLAAGDLDGDGNLDLVTANQDPDTVSVLPGNGDGTFAAKIDFATGSGPHSVAVSDLDGDGDLDLVTANAFADTVSVLLNNNVALRRR